MVDVERSKLESGLTLLLLSMVGIALVALSSVRQPSLQPLSSSTVT
jgi:hypothetical protein